MQSTINLVAFFLTFFFRRLLFGNSSIFSNILKFWIITTCLFLLMRYILRIIFWLFQTSFYWTPSFMALKVIKLLNVFIFNKWFFECLQNKRKKNCSQSPLDLVAFLFGRRNCVLKLKNDNLRTVCHKFEILEACIHSKQTIL